MHTQAAEEVIEGYVVEMACLRKYPRHDTLRRAREHSRQCLLMGPCVESGFALVSDDDRVTVLDSEATRQILAVVQQGNRAGGIKLRLKRALRDEASARGHGPTISTEGQ